MWRIALVIVVVGIIAGVIVVVLDRHYKHKKHKKSPKRVTNTPTTPYSLGVQHEPYKSANLCDDTVLYPLNSIDVDYNYPKGSLPPIPDDCPCTMFIKSP